MAIISVVLSLTGFISVKTFPILMEIVGLHGCLAIYGSGCIAGVIFVIVVLKETRGQSIDNDDDLNGKYDPKVDSSKKVH